MLPKILTPIKLLIPKPILGAPKNLNSLGDHLKKKRLESGLTQEQLAKKLGISIPIIHKLEVGRKHSLSNTIFYQLISFLNYCPLLEDVPQTTGAQIHFYRRHQGISRSDLARMTGIREIEIRLWEKENFLVGTRGLGFTPKKQQALETALGMDNLPTPSQTFLTGALPLDLDTIGQHLAHYRTTHRLGIREVSEVLETASCGYRVWERDAVGSIKPASLVKIVGLLGYCPLETYQTVGEKLRLYRTHAGLEQSELAEKLGCHSTTVFQWENDRWKIPQEIKNKLNKYLGAGL